MKVIVQPQQKELSNAVILATVNPFRGSIDVDATSHHLNDYIVVMCRMAQHTNIIILPVQEIFGITVAIQKRYR
jgi:hypothetical protein